MVQEDGVTLNHGREYRAKNITASEAAGALEEI
jgi:hypothetical protein